MAFLEASPVASGAPGISPRWTHSAKDVIGTAYSTSSRVWFTISDGVISEVYYSTLDRPQIRDLQLLVTDGETFFHDSHRDLKTSIEYLGEHGLGVRIINADPDGRYRLVMEVISDPHLPCVLVDTRVEGEPAWLRKLHVYALLAPHLEVSGWGNNGNVGRMSGREFLTAHKDGTWLAMAATAPFVRSSCGYVGTTDGWQDLASHFRLTNQFAAAPDGNIALTAEIDLPEDRHFTLGLAFGNGLHRAVTCLYQSLGVPFAQHSARFIEQWSRACGHMYPLGRWTGDNGQLSLGHGGFFAAGAYTAGVTTGSTVYVAGGGPVGLACAASAQLLGAAVVIVGDMNAERLAQARSFGCETIDATVQGCDCFGFHLLADAALIVVLEQYGVVFGIAVAIPVSIPRFS